MNKKAFLLGEFTMKIIIAALCIALLVYLLFAIYSLFTGKTETAQAQATLDSIIEKIGLVGSGNPSSLEIILYNPKDWLLYYSENGAPAACEGKKCLCICKEAGFFTNQLEACNKNGVCKQSSASLKIKSVIFIDTTKISIKKEASGVLISKA